MKYADIENTDPFKTTLARIAVDPADTKLRLRFADFIGSQDQEWADFIHYQLRLNEMKLDHPERFRICQRIEVLMLDRSEDWISSWYAEVGIRKVRENGTSPVQFHGGFIEGIIANADTFLQAGVCKRLFSSQPIKHLTIVALDGDQQLDVVLSEFVRIGVVDKLVTLALGSFDQSTRLTDRSIDSLIQHGFTSLHGLYLYNNAVTQPGVRKLCDAFPDLKVVDLEGNPCNPVDMACEDQGIIVDMRTSRDASGLPDRPWFRAQQNMRYDRFRL